MSQSKMLTYVLAGPGSVDWATTPHAIELKKNWFDFWFWFDGILCPIKIVVVNEGVIVLDVCTKLKGSPDSAAGSTLF